MKIRFEKSIKVESHSLYLTLHTKRGNYNPETSICISKLNFACSEEQLIEELNLILKNDFLATLPSTSQERKESNKKPEHFVLSCIVSSFSD